MNVVSVSLLVWYVIGSSRQFLFRGDSLVSGYV